MMLTTVNQLLDAATAHIGRMTMDAMAKDLEIATLQSMVDALTPPPAPEDDHG